MLAVLSPAKTLDYGTPLRTQIHTHPEFVEESNTLIQLLKEYDSSSLQKLMKISEKIATLNQDRYASFQADCTHEHGRQAILAFKGDSYHGFELDTYDDSDFEFIQSHLRILSGLYGILRPLDLMQPYRLEMGTRLPNARGKDLYTFWGKQIAQTLNQALHEQGDDILINLASNEYFKSVHRTALQARVIQPVFKEEKNGQYKIVAIYAKKARGAMVNYIVRNRLKNSEDLQSFDVDGYRFSSELSDDSTWTFIR